GLGNLTFTSEDFSAGSQLSAGVSFVNTGDVSIRGSEDNPVTVTLNVSGDGFTSRKLAEWKVSENIRSGQEVQLFGTLTLPLTLPKGSEFSVTVSEDATYAEDPFSATVKGVYTIEQKTELGFENYDISLKRMDNGKLSLDENGNAILDVDLFVGNRGTKDSENVYIQFSYGVYDPELATRVKDKKGEDSDWSDTIYSALDITGHKLEVGEEEELPLLPPAGNANEDAAEGILNLGQIRAGYGRHVRGTIKVKADEFLYFGDDCINDPAGSMKLAVEIYGSDDVTLKDDFNIRHAERDEYNKINNTCDIVIEHTTSFVVPKKLEIPAGMRFRLPVSYSTTLGDQMPDINVVELTDSEIGKEALSGAGNGLSATGAENDNMDKSADVVSYENSSFKKGYGNGTVILRGGKEGNSYIRIQDMTTNSYQDIAVKFTAPADGLDIGTGSGLFTFLDENGKAAKSGGNSWEFQEDVEHWGKKGEKPFMGTLASGKPGTSFCFLTEAETIKLYFDGAVTVSSDFDGFRSVSRTSEGEPKEIYFGANPSNKAHTVTVTVTGVSSRGLYADFDRLDVFYSGDKVDLTEWQNDNPVSLVWGSTFPAPGSLSEGQVFDATAFVIDNEKADPDDLFSGLHFNWIKWIIGDNVTQLSFERRQFRTYKWNVRFTKNGKAEFVFIGAYGKEVRSVLNVDWWETDGSSDYPEKSPALPYYEKKYPGVIDVVTPAGSTIEYLDNSWMTAGLDGNNVRVSIQDDAPADSLHVYLVDHDHYLRTLSLNKEYDPIELKKGETGSFSLRDGANGLHMLLAEAVVSKGADEKYDYHIFRSDGRIEKHNAEDVVHRNLEFLSLAYPNKLVDPELNPIPTV
ncbi:MAG: hypothetical protein IJT00_06595, partial [Lachnospiraceae bacterium]|nr:hypothetical protein [Lachnospiraceae bacterium]